MLIPHSKRRVDSRDVSDDQAAGVMMHRNSWSQMCSFPSNSIISVSGDHIFKAYSVTSRRK
ncbi:hypothetical protein E2C01_026637 [Portunus trituberculatus]|uniref:Uncharacterized protein n=1 Tax=Portunus trituberculatus TaxID=210409 RepID=A0A5B7EJQ8_PORTR|nr:hypothetical protein [Portunus trituberculatus]